MVRQPRCTLSLSTSLASSSSSAPCSGCEVSSWPGDRGKKPVPGTRTIPFEGTVTLRQDPSADLHFPPIKLTSSAQLRSIIIRELPPDDLPLSVTLNQKVPPKSPRRCPSLGSTMPIYPICADMLRSHCSLSTYETPMQSACPSDRRR